jgi:hypothetical protein
MPPDPAGAVEPPAFAFLLAWSLLPSSLHAAAPSNNAAQPSTPAAAPQDVNVEVGATGMAPDQTLEPILAMRVLRGSMRVLRVARTWDLRLHGRHDQHR